MRGVGTLPRRKKPVVVVEYDPAWPLAFERLRARVAAALGELCLAVEHVGSTAVPGLPAKPIVDLDAVVPSAAAIPEAVTRLAAIGYTHQGDLGIPGREAFDGLPPGPGEAPWPAHNLYVCPADGEELRRHLAFRDYLRAHPEDARAYAAAKLEGARRFPNDRDAYQEFKSATVQDILRRALATPPSTPGGSRRPGTSGRPTAGRAPRRWRGPGASRPSPPGRPAPAPP
jgi:GrpB-like predicted nucleotidyltransferase (UPF0157 family)